jgi:hypothetical protein
MRLPPYAGLGALKPSDGRSRHWRFTLSAEPVIANPEGGAVERIEADILIPGRGEPIHDGCVVLDGPTIAYAGPTAGAPATPGAGIYRVPAVLPGLWDCRAHFMGVFTSDLAELATNAPA